MYNTATKYYKGDYTDIKETQWIAFNCNFLANLYIENPQGLLTCAVYMETTNYKNIQWRFILRCIVNNYNNFVSGWIDLLSIHKDIIISDKKVENLVLMFVCVMEL